MNSLGALLITVGAGLSFWLGALVTKLVNNKKALNQLAIGLAFTVLVGLILVDFIPHLGEVFEHASLEKRFINIGFYILLGLVILKLLDYFIPAHYHEHHNVHDDKEEHNNHLFHIGVVTSISLMIHNLIEGLSIYNLALTNVKSGLLMALGVVVHNIPLGVSIFATMGLDKMNKRRKISVMSLLSISTGLGALIIYLAGGQIGEYVDGLLVCMTLGMILYITIFELAKELLNNIKSKYSLIGMSLGLLIVLLTIVI